MKKLLTILLIITNSSCALLFNKREVEVTFNSLPEGAEVYVEGKNIGKTPVVANIEPTINRSILYTKPGYANREFTIYKVVGDSRLRPSTEYSMCVIDAFGAILIVPLFSVLSTKCSHFDKTTYFKALDKGDRQNVISQVAAD